MKVLAINGSPHMDKGSTALILNPFLEGIRSAGGDVELFYTGKLEIKPCSGDMGCWLKHPGKCAIKDDMQKLYPLVREADAVVFASPVYNSSITAPLKSLIDRMLPIGQPFMEIKDGHTYQPNPEGTKEKKVVLVSSCSYWEMDNFDPLIVWMNAFCRSWSMAFAGALLRPHGEALRPMMDMGAPVGDVLQAAREAGRQLAAQGAMSEETLKIVGRELLPQEMYIGMMNEFFEKEMGASGG
jgi:multimeric flavodoxin WrbA